MGVGKWGAKTERVGREGWGIGEGGGARGGGGTQPANWQRRVALSLSLSLSVSLSLSSFIERIIAQPVALLATRSRTPLEP
jgi:hypothetical protein